jgi:hypothetical protein
MIVKGREGLTGSSDLLVANRVGVRVHTIIVTS